MLAKVCLFFCVFWSLSEALFLPLFLWFGRWDCSFHNGRLVEEVDGHTAILYHRLLLDWFPM